jgi:hypothetical protein
MRRVIVASLAVAAGLLPSAVQARQDSAEPPSKVVTIRPAAAPVPALKYRLLPERRELLPGNAAIFYHRAIERLMDVRHRQAMQSQAAGKSPVQMAAEDEKLQQDLAQPLASFPRELARRHLEQHALTLHEVELGARREFCDWEFQHRDEGFTLLIEEIQQARGLARLVALKIRLEIAEGRLDSAFHWLQTGFALTRHAGQGNIFVQSLISAAITSLMADTLEEFVQAIGAPNLYWALANLPRPFLDLTEAIEGERFILEKEFPRLRELGSGPWTVEQARAFADELKQKYAALTDDLARAESPTARPEMKDLGEHLLFATLVARAYPTAKRALIAEGRPAAVVEAMPAIQVVALHSYGQYEEARDDIFKWAGLPYWQGHQGLEQAQSHPRVGWNALKAGIPFALVLPAIRSVFVVPVRVDRRLDVVQIIEAIRLYAASHEGKLPPSLEAITEAPVPMDPATCKPFEYRADGDTATLSAPPPPGWQQFPQFKIHYTLKIAR